MYTEIEMIKALERSGYLLESEIIDRLIARQYFFEANQIIVDQESGKAREIDIVAEQFPTERIFNNTISLTIRYRFSFEVKNNPPPLVILSEFRSSPMLDETDAIKSIDSFDDRKAYDKYYEYFSEVRGKSFGPVCTQYCSFIPKKGSNELMATHPDNLYAGIQKITQWCEDQLNSWSNLKEEHSSDRYRHWVCVPVVIINDNLYSYLDDGMQSIKYGVILHRYLHGNERKAAFVHVVQKNSLEEFLNKFEKLATAQHLSMVETYSSNLDNDSHQ